MMSRPAPLGIIGWVIVVGAVVLAGASSPARAYDLNDSELHFTLNLPPGFIRAPQFVGVRPNIVHAFTRGTVAGGTTPGMLILIEKLGGTISREHLTMDKLPPGSKTRIFTTKWQGFDVDVCEVPEIAGSTPVLTYNAQIPLRSQAIQVKVFGPASRKKELNAILTATVAGLQGESNWVALGGTQLSESGYRTLLLGITIVSVVGGLVGFWLMMSRTPRGTIQALAIFLYCFGTGLETVQVREAKLVSGICKMLGFGGFLIGILQYTRKPKAADPDAWIIEGSPSW